MFTKTISDCGVWVDAGAGACVVWIGLGRRRGECNRSSPPATQLLTGEQNERHEKHELEDVSVTAAKLALAWAPRVARTGLGSQER